ncbi:hypothetical protein EUX98_g3930 [Antrodiella citrinella]|uniref:Uncharacterized protein n=1 Tax=Antrodiella citrinella TaxID=2447956 RepID=A0A4S4MXE5_9APHY|nr:hypothetical protein EUX98_g3930 [Antrodiella citrinella]
MLAFVLSFLPVAISIRAHSCRSSPKFNRSAEPHLSLLCEKHLAVESDSFVVVSGSDSAPLSDSGHLPTDVRPLRYEVEVITDLNQLTFKGVVTIRLDVLKATYVLTFHSSGLQVGFRKLLASHDGHTQEVSIRKVTTDVRKELMTLHLSDELHASRSHAELVLDFGNELANGQGGYGRVKWEDGREEYYAFTQLAVVQHGTSEDYTRVKDIAQNKSSASTRIAALRALGASSDLELANQTWEYIMANTLGQDLAYLVIGLKENRKTRKFLARKFKENYDELAG